MELDPEFLSRLQFAFVISFHILFPAFTIGLAAYIALLETLWMWTGREVYGRVSRFWINIFAVSFGMGVVSGIVMSYQFGTNWSRFSDITANVLGPLLSYEVLTAFFLEATFLGILLFGRSRVPRGLHVLSAIAVAIGTLISTFWILSANSWMQTPAGTELRDGLIHVTSWWDAVFNPSFPYRLAHMVTAAFLTTAFVVIAVAAWYLRRGRAVDEARTMLSMTLWLVTALAPLQLLLGDMHGLNTFEHQPAKIAAMEGHWETRAGAPLILFAWPDMEAELNHLEIAVPKLGSVILTHDSEGVVRGLKEWPPSDRAYVPLVFWAFRIMVGIGVLMIAVAAASVWLRWRGRLFGSSGFLRVCTWCLPLGFIAVIAGWTVTEAGRQPWTVYGLLRTAESVSPSLTGHSVLISLLVYFAAYAVIFTGGVYYMVRIVQRGPEEIEIEPRGRMVERARRPLSTPDVRFGGGRT
jgi:cytochrome d ubiquinol oxidase subunit I